MVYRNSKKERDQMKKCDYNRCENSAVAHIDYCGQTAQPICGPAVKFYCAKHYDFIVKYLAKDALDPDDDGWSTKILRRNGVR